MCHLQETNNRSILPRDAFPLSFFIFGKTFVHCLKKLCSSGKDQTTLWFMHWAVSEQSMFCVISGISGSGCLSWFVQFPSWRQASNWICAILEPKLTVGLNYTFLDSKFGFPLGLRRSPRKCQNRIATKWRGHLVVDNKASKKTQVLKQGIKLNEITSTWVSVR